jgi:hypothetical protein
LVLFALGQPLSPAKAVVIESLSMTARSAGFFIPGALGIQEIALILVANLVGLSAETAILIGILKRLRDVRGAWPPCLAMDRRTSSSGSRSPAAELSERPQI